MSSIPPPPPPPPGFLSAVKTTPQPTTTSSQQPSVATNDFVANQQTTNSQPEINQTSSLVLENANLDLPQEIDNVHDLRKVEKWDIDADEQV